jgi:hypothetical protein
MRILLKEISRDNSHLCDFASDVVSLTIHIYPVLNKPIVRWPGPTFNIFHLTFPIFFAFTGRTVLV